MYTQMSDQKPPPSVSHYSQHTPKITTKSVKNLPMASTYDIMSAHVQVNPNLAGPRPEYQARTPLRNEDARSQATRDSAQQMQRVESIPKFRQSHQDLNSQQINRSQSNALLPRASSDALIQSAKRSIGFRGGSTLSGAQSVKKIYGIDSYTMPHILGPVESGENGKIRYTIPKDNKNSFFQHITRSSKGVPGPDKYSEAPSWKVHQKNFGVGPARKTFTDEAQAHSKTIPAPTAYKPVIKHKLLLGQMEKAEGINYLSDQVYLAKCQPGPEKYKPKPEFLKPRVTEVKFHPCKGKKDWKPKKTREPDPGSYDFRKGQRHCGKSDFIHKFAAPRGEHQTPKETFTTVSCKRKKFVPGVGTYNPKLDFIAIPYSRKRGC